MNKFYIPEITTKDKIIHQGMYFRPDNKLDVAVLWVHGLTDTFYGDIFLFEHFINLNKNIGLASFNSRGHDLITGLRRVDSKSPSGYIHVNGGAGREVFTDCIYDIDAGINFLVKEGFKTIILIGHSTGANKVCYYAGKTRDPRVDGVVLASPISDRLIEEKLNKKLPQNLRRMKHMVEKSKGEFLVKNLTFFPLTPKRYLSLFDKNSIEDIFDYGDLHPKLKYFSQITKPLLVVLSEKDEYADRPATSIKKVFDAHTKNKKYISIVMKNACHGYNGQENEFTQIVVNWIKSI